jgi:hypothetical protein
MRGISALSALCLSATPFNSRCFVVALRLWLIMILRRSLDEPLSDFVGTFSHDSNSEIGKEIEHASKIEVR